MKTLLAAKDSYYLSNGDMADIVRQVSDEPGKNPRELFRQAVFNALIGNTDDHLKNFTMMRSERGWHLTPTYDLLPDVNNTREHMLSYGTGGTLPFMETLYWLGDDCCVIRIVHLMSSTIDRAIFSRNLDNQVFRFYARHGDDGQRSVQRPV